MFTATVYSGLVAASTVASVVPPSVGDDQTGFNVVMILLTLLQIMLGLH